MPSKKIKTKRIVGNTPKNVKGLVKPKDANPKKKLTFTFFLNPVKKKIPQPKALQSLNKRKNILSTRKDFNKEHASTKEDIAALKKFTDKYNLKMSKVKLTERWVSFVGKIEDIEKALKIDIWQYDFEDFIYYFHEGIMEIPKEIDHLIEAITGINKAPIKERRIFPTEIDLKHSMLEGSAVQAKDFAKLYNFPKDLDGSGQCIGIISLGGGYDENILKKYFKKQGIPMPDISWVGVHGAKNNPGENIEYDYEVYMDIEIAGSLAPGARIVVYFAENHTSNILKAFREAIHDHKNKPDVISMSWGTLEENFSRHEAMALNNVLKEAAQLNITLICSSGDLGSSGKLEQTGLNVQLPASSPYVLAVGGSQSHVEDNKILHEDVWKQDQELNGQKIHFSSGGGFSEYFEIPHYQKEVLPLAFARKKKRGIPDVAANASTTPGVILNVGETVQISMGTSASTPLWAALISRINQKLTALNLPHIGFIHPFLYQDEFRPLFNQVLDGGNGGYEATGGWDPCTGLGTPDGEKFLEQIIKAQTQLHSNQG